MISSVKMPKKAAIQVDIGFPSLEEIDAEPSDIDIESDEAHKLLEETFYICDSDIGF